jgi:hypothetical protein
MVFEWSLDGLWMVFGWSLTEDLRPTSLGDEKSKTLVWANPGDQYGVKTAMH